MNKKLILILLSAITSTSYAITDKTKDEIIIEINNHKPKITKEYLQNYALNNEEKKKNIIILAKKYITKKNISNKEYIQEFTYEAEKQVFAEFLREHGQECSRIDEGPLFKTDINAYEVKCINKNYYMVFNYNNKIWSILETIK